MPIIDPKTDLRSLSYKEFGTIGDPLVVKDIPAVNQDGPSKGVLKQVTARTDDALRMTRLLVLQGGKRNPAGNKFTANLALLNQQETISKVRKLEKGSFKDGLKNVGKSFLGGAADTGKTLASILAQVPVAGTGTHFVNGGKVGKEYLKGGGNPLGQLFRSIVGAGGGLQGHERVLSGRPIEINKQSVDNEDGSLLDKYDEKVKDKDQVGKQRDSNLRQPYKANPDVIKTRMVNQGDQGKFPGGTPGTLDLLNASDILYENDFREKDIIPFEFQIFDPKAGGEPKFLYFRAYLRDLSDSYTGEWNSTKYVGRAEPLYNYNGFNRSLGFSFNIAAHTRSELGPLYNKLNYLVGSTAPSYSSNQTFMRGVFCKVTVGDYLVQIPGFFTAINITWNTNYPWEIGIDENYEAIDTILVPHLLDIQAQFQPVHDFNPELGKAFITDRQPIAEKTLKGETLTGTQKIDPISFGTTTSVPSIELEKAVIEKQSRFRKFVKSTRDFVEKATELGDVEQEKVKTIDIDATDTFNKNDGNLNDLF